MDRLRLYCRQDPKERPTAKYVVGRKMISYDPNCEPLHTTIVAGCMFNVTQPEASGFSSAKTGKGAPFVIFKTGYGL